MLARIIGPHRPQVELALVVAAYGLYELLRRLAVANTVVAEHNAQLVVQLERRLHLLDEHRLQRFALGFPHLAGLLGELYLPLHFFATAVALVWLYRHRPHVFAFARSTLLSASLLADAGYALFPTAPPRLVPSLKIEDTLAQVNQIDLGHGLVSSLYNPFAAVPSMHFGYALVLGIAFAVLAQRLIWRTLALCYPAVVLLVIVATGNHFFFDAAAGALTVTLAAALSLPAYRTRNRLPRTAGAEQQPATLPRWRSNSASAGVPQ